MVGDGLDQALTVLVGHLGATPPASPVPRQLVPSSSSHTRAFISTRSTTPLNSASGRWGAARGAGGRPAVDHHLDATEEVGADAVHLVDVGDARDVVLVGLAPDGLGLGLDAADGAEEGDRAVEHAQAALDLRGEIHVSGRVDDVDAVVAPVAGGGRGGDGDAALLLLVHPVHGGGAFVHLAHLVRLARVEEDALGGRGLAGVDVRHDADVARLFERVLSHASFDRSAVRGALAQRTLLRDAPGEGAATGYQR